MANRFSIDLRAVGSREGILALENAFQVANHWDDEEKLKAEGIGFITQDSLHINYLSAISEDYYYADVSCRSRFDLETLLDRELPNSLQSLIEKYDLIVETISSSESDPGGIRHTFFSGAAQGECFDLYLSASFDPYYSMPEEHSEKKDCILSIYDAFYEAGDTRILGNFLFLDRKSLTNKLEELRRKKMSSEEWKF